MRRWFAVLLVSFVEPYKELVLYLSMIGCLKVMLVCSQCLRAAPGHVAHQGFFASLNLASCLRLFTDEPYVLGDKSMPEPVDVQINPDNLTEPIPMFLEAIVVVGVPAA